MNTDNIEVLSIRLGPWPGPYQWIECTKRRFYEALRPFAYKAHYHAANLAAHGWDVLLIDGRLFVGSPGGEGTFKGPGPTGHWVSETFERTDATEAELAALYRPGERLFPLPEPTPESNRS